MSIEELNKLTVPELRKIAVEHGIALDSRAHKADIINCLSVGFNSETSANQKIQTTEQESVSETTVHSGPRFNTTPAWKSTSISNRSVMQNNIQRPAPSRPIGFTPRFGPASVQSNATTQTSTVQLQSHEHRFGPSSETRPRYNPQPVTTFGPLRNGQNPQKSLSHPPVKEQIETSTQNKSPLHSDTPYIPPVPQDLGITPPSLEDLLAEYPLVKGQGILELHPDGYGFLRTESFLPSAKDIYVSLAQVRRFSLRTGDRIEGILRPQKEADKYEALLYITAVNGISNEESSPRVSFEELATVPSSVKINMQPLEEKKRAHIRFIDLIAPIAFGQRGLILCPPKTGKLNLIGDMAVSILENQPDTEVMVLLLNTTVEEVDFFKSNYSIPVLSSTTDQAPESHLRLTEVVLERAMRLVEHHRNVVIFADSMTRLAKVYSTAATQQGRSLPGMVNPTSLFRAKKMFSSARCIKDGGSLTVIATMDIETGSKVDDSVVEEFKSIADMQLKLDQSVANKNILPPLDLHYSFSRHPEVMLSPEAFDGLKCIQSLVVSMQSDLVIPQLLSLMDKAPTNEDLLVKMKSWFSMMNNNM